jgi:hypothetical protein
MGSMTATGRIGVVRCRSVTGKRERGGGGTVGPTPREKGLKKGVGPRGRKKVWWAEEGIQLG